MDLASQDNCILPCEQAKLVKRFDVFKTGLTDKLGYAQKKPALAYAKAGALRRDGRKELEREAKSNVEPLHIIVVVLCKNQTWRHIIRRGNP